MGRDARRAVAVVRRGPRAGVIGPAVVTAGVLAFVAGFLTLVLRSPNEPEDGWDDGSVV